MRGAPHEFPIGAEIASRWRVVEGLRGGPDRGQFRAAGDRPALVTMSSPQTSDGARLVARMGWDVPGVAALLWSGRVVGEGVDYDVLVEAEPPGATLAIWRGSAAATRGVARRLADIVRAAFERGIVLGGVRPELVYIDDDEVSGVAPRAERFLAGSTERCYGVPPCFEDVYLAPEQLALRPPGPPADVFALGATLARLFTGRAPFAGQTLMERMSSALRGRFGPLDAAGPLAPVLAAMMSVEPADRPSIGEVRQALA